MDISSARFKLNSNDIQSWLKNFGIFGAPLLLAFLLELQAGVSLRVALTFVYLAALQAIIDLLRKFINGKPELG